MRIEPRVYSVPLAVALVGALALWLVPLKSFEIRPGQVVAGCFVIGFQILLSWLVYVQFAPRPDDRSVNWQVERVGSWVLFGFGMASSASMLLSGSFGTAYFNASNIVDDDTMRRGELILGVILVVVAFVLIALREGRFAAGWSFGFAIGVAIGQERLVPTTDAEDTRWSWGLIGLTMVLIAAVCDIASQRKQRSAG